MHQITKAELVRVIADAISAELAALREAAKEVKNE